MMKRLFLFLAVTTFLGGAQARGQAGPPPPSAAWERMTYPGEEFSAEWPASPFVFHDSRPIYGSRKSETARVFGLYWDGVIYMVYSFDKPRGGETLDFFAGIPHGGRMSLPITREGLRLNGFEGREYGHTRRVFRAKRHAYFVQAAGPGGKDDPSVARFLDSFALGASPAGKEIGTEWYVQNGRPAPPTPAAHAAPVEPLRSREVTRKAVIVYKPAPGYTEEARKNDVAGVVRLRAVLSSYGRLTNISVIKGLPDGLTEKAIHAALHILFFPAEKDGRRVSQWVTLEYNFNIY